MPEPRLALCGNVFPAAGPEEVLAAVTGPVRAWSEGLIAAGAQPPFGFGLFFSASAAQAFLASEDLQARLQQALGQAQVECWTANAFPFGDFHAAEVKEQAFLPDWRSPERVQFTLDVATLLAGLAPADGRRLSVSTCPLGYGPEAVGDPGTLTHLQEVAAGLRALGERSGREIVLAIEPEPDGGFERVSELAAWLARHLSPAEREQVGICWDLCHSAVVGEATEDVLASLENSGVRLGKIQVSSALRIPGTPDGPQMEQLGRLTADPYLHQVRGRDPHARAGGFRDVPEFLADPEASSWSDLRIHCHVPVSADAFPGGFEATPWRPAVAEALRAGLRDFELETYTLPVLPEAFLEAQGPVGTMVAESLACLQALELDTGSP